MMGPGAMTTNTGKALIRGLRRSIRDMTEPELRANLEDIRDKVDQALNAGNPDSALPFPLDLGAPSSIPPAHYYFDDAAGHDEPTVATGQ